MADGTLKLHNRSTDPSPPPAGTVAVYQKGVTVYQIDEFGVVTPLGMTSVPAHAATHESGGTDEIDVTGLLGVLTDPQPPSAHAASHEKIGSDPIETALLGTANMDTTKRLAPDGAGGVAWDDAGATDVRDNVVFDHFVTGNLDSDELGQMGWRTNVTGTGADLSTAPEPGHPGVLNFGCGTAAAGRAGIYLGQAGITNFNFSTAQNAILWESLVKFNVGALSALNLERWTAAFGDSFDGAASTEHANGVYVEFDPVTSTQFRLRTASASVRSAANSGIVVLANTWYRLGVQMSWPGGVPTAQLYVNGVLTATLTTNIPTIVAAIGYQGDANATATEARYQVDYCSVNQITAKET